MKNMRNYLKKNVKKNLKRQISTRQFDIIQLSIKSNFYEIKFIS